MANSGLQRLFGDFCKELEEYVIPTDPGLLDRYAASLRQSLGDSHQIAVGDPKYLAVALLGHIRFLRPARVLKMADQKTLPGWKVLKPYVLATAEANRILKSFCAPQPKQDRAARLETATGAILLLFLYQRKNGREAGEDAATGVDASEETEEAMDDSTD